MRRRPVLLAVALAVAAPAAASAFGSASTLPVTPRPAGAFRACVLTAYPAASTAVADTWADQTAPASNRGAETYLQVTTKNNANRRAYVRFDLTRCAPAITASAVVTRATLRLSLKTAPASSRTYELRRVTAPCPELAGTCWTETGLTWTAQPAVAVVPTATLALTSSSPLRYYALDVTADTAALTAGTAPNYGWRIQDSEEDLSQLLGIALFGITAQFHAKEAAGNAAGAPQLVVAYRP